MTGSGKRATVEFAVESKDDARVLQSIGDTLKRADTDALFKFEQVLVHAMDQAGGNATDALDCIIAACVHQWRQEGLPELAAVRS